MSDFKNICAFGGYWCRRCQRYVAVATSETGRPNACQQCGSIKLRFDPPIEGFSTSEHFKTDPKEAHV